MPSNGDGLSDNEERLVVQLLNAIDVRLSGGHQSVMLNPNDGVEHVDDTPAGGARRWFTHFPWHVFEVLADGARAEGWDVEWRGENLVIRTPNG